MKTSTFTLAALAAPLVAALPAGLTKKQTTNIDTTVLQFALTLEHLENVFYKGALAKFTQQDFANAGYGPNYYNNLKYIAYDEQVHVQFLSSALQSAGVTPNAACTYNFPYTDVNSFITLSSILEGVGTSAYLGGAPLITNKAYLTAAGSILVTEALHTSMQRGAIKEVPEPNPFGTPLDPTSVYTLAAMFIVSCPASNAPLPFTPFPTLTLNTTGGTCEEPNCSAGVARRDARPDGWSNMMESSSDMESKTATESYMMESKTATESYMTGSKTATETHMMESKTATATATGTATACDSSWENYGAAATVTVTATASGYDSGYTSAPAAPALKAGQSITLSINSTTPIPANTYVTFVSGLTILSIPGSASGESITATIPSAVSGQVYVFLTFKNVTGTFDDTAVLAGPAILEVAPAAPVLDGTQ